MKDRHAVRLLCELLEVSPSGYYRWVQARPTRRQHDDAVLSARIVTAHRRSRKNYGAPRLVEDLRAEGTPISKRRCARLMKAEGIHGRKKHRRRPRTTDSRHPHPPAKNLLAERPAPNGPNQAWMTDITYLPTAEGWLYLAAILDVWSRRVVGWACGPTLHGRSDAASLSVMESFWSTLKTETELDARTPISRRAAELAVFDYIETFYNPTRRHSSLGYVSPVAFEKQPNLNDIKAA